MGRSPCPGHLNLTLVRLGTRISDSMRVTVIFAAVIAALAFSVSARAAPPVLTTVGQIDGHPTASWTLPPGGETWVVEIAHSTAAGSDGHFSLENRVVYDALFNSSTSWTDSGYPLQPGTYYVHVSAPHSRLLLPQRRLSHLRMVERPHPGDPGRVVTPYNSTTCWGRRGRTSGHQNVQLLSPRSRQQATLEVHLQRVRRRSVDRAAARLPESDTNSEREAGDDRQHLQAVR